MKKIIITALSILIATSSTPAYAKNKPLNSKSNKSACSYIKSNYKSNVMSDWSNGIGNDSEVIKEVQDNIKMLTKRNILTNGAINKQISLWIGAEKNTEKSISEANGEQLITSMNEKITIVKKFDSLCKSIGK